MVTNEIDDSLRAVLIDEAREALDFDPDSVRIENVATGETVAGGQQYLVADIVISVGLYRGSQPQPEHAA
jgi:hypothetical protein